MLSVKQKLRLVAFALGIFIAYALFGVMQERIFRGHYRSKADEDGNGERFTYSVTFVAIQCIVYSVFAKGVTSVQDQVENITNQKFYFFIAIFYVAAMVTSSMALEWLSYPTQVVAKASKPIPVMLLGVIIGKKSYSAIKYLIVLMIVIGVGLFIFQRKIFAGNSEISSTGLCLISFSLLMDGMTGAMQDRMRAAARPTSMQIMLYINSWSGAILITIMAITGEGRDFINFASKHPSIIWQITIAVVVGTIGQIFISIMISNFGSLPLSIVTTTRKFFTVFVSVIFFGNELSIQQWIATAIIFTALLLDACFSKKAHKNEDESDDDSTSTEQSTNVITSL